MNEQMNRALEPLKRFWGNASKLVKRLIVGGFVALLITALVVSIVLNTKEYVVIFQDLSETETTEIFKALEGTDYDVKVDSEGNFIVLDKQEAKVRMQLAMAGYPKSGLNYSLVEDTSGMLTTDYERKQAENRQLQERIGASIQTLEGVEQAIVTITPGDENVFYLQEKEEPSASVVVHMKEDFLLDETQVSGIINLVSKSVSGLKKENIALTDGKGNELIEDDGKGDNAKVTITNAIENQIKKKVTTVLQGPYDLSQFKVSVTAVVDTDKMIREELTYVPSPDGENSGVISEEGNSSESSTSTEEDGGVPGTSTNSEVSTYPVGGGTGESSSTASSEEIKYLVSHIKEQTEKAGAYIESVSIGISIDKASFQPGEKENIIEVVAFAAGVDQANVSVQNFKFYKEDVESEDTAKEGSISKEMLFIIIGAAAVLLVLIIALVIIISKKKKAKALAELEAQEALEAEEREKALNEAFGKPEEKVEPLIAKLEPVLDARRTEVKDFALSNPEIAAQMIRTWLKNEND